MYAVLLSILLIACGATHTEPSQDAVAPPVAEAPPSATPAAEPAPPPPTEDEATAPEPEGDASPAKAEPADDAAPPSPKAPSDASVPDGGTCLTSAACASGTCEGQGCTDDAPGTCVPEMRRCTRDRRPYCGCDGETLWGSSTCVNARYERPGICGEDL